LLIGIIGLRPPPLPINRRPPAQEEIVATVIEPLLTPVQAVSPDSGDSMSEKAPDDAPPGVAVTVDSPEVVFSVPTVGNLLVAMNMAQAPPSQPMAGAVPLSGVNIERIAVTSVGGSRPPPSYPRDSLRDREQGTVELLIEVDENGSVTSVTPRESSGYGRLDRAACEHVRRTWMFGPSKTKRLYSCPIIFQLQ
jgi:protein TonB